MAEQAPDKEPLDLEELVRENQLRLLARWLPSGSSDGRRWTAEDWEYNLSYQSWTGPGGSSGKGLIMFRKEQLQLRLDQVKKRIIQDLEDLGIIERGAKLDKRKKLRPHVPVPPDAAPLDWETLPRDEVSWRRFGSKYLPTAWWEYRGVDGELLGYVVRFEPPNEPKWIRPLLWCGTGQGWKFTDWPLPLPLYGLEELAKRPKDPILVVEGEKTRDAAQKLFPDYVVVTWPGGTDRVHRAQWGWLKGRDVTLWPDADLEGRQAMDSLQFLLRSHGVRGARRVYLPPNMPDGWDLADEPPRNYDVRRALESAQDLPPEIEELNQKHAVVTEAGRTVVFTQTYDPILSRHYWSSGSFTDFRNRYLNRQVVTGAAGRNLTPTVQDLGQFWLEHEGRRTYDGLIFRPGGEIPGYLNLWRGWGVEAQPGDWSLLQEHIRDNLCGGVEEYFEYVLNWSARLVQEPEQAAGVAIVLRGKRGTGKGTFAQALGKLFGPHFIQVSNSKHLLGNFNFHLRTAVLVYADEAFWAGDKQGESVLKTMITEEVIPIEQKGRDLVVVKNMTHPIIATNHDWAVPAGPWERRYLVLDVVDGMMQNREYFAKILAQLRSGGYAGMLHDLMQRDISGFDVFDVPKTQALLDQKIYSMEPAYAWWLDLLQRGKLPSDEHGEGRVPFDILVEGYEKAVGKAQSRSAQTKLGMQLRRWLADVRLPRAPKVERFRRHVGWNQDGTPRLALERGRVYYLPTLKACREAFVRELGQAVPWDVPDAEWAKEEWEAELEPVSDNQRPY